ncbi:isatin hydrolase-like [Argiope bruennichi]|uniref:isatin hydrolase-like n=1 Tax=Argiope bruennichi TaxID=94029 RepID=UPI002494E9AB|nr:isatin hydrolase-like [Argiope bruennichi]
MFLVLICSLVYSLHAFPLPVKLVDMTHTFDETVIHYPFVNGFQMETEMNGTELNGVWILTEKYSSSIHVGTHMDAPLHFIPDGLAVDQIPINHFFAPAAVIDITEKAELDPDAEVTVEDLLNWECLTEQSLNGTIVLLKSGWGKRWNDEIAFLGTSDGHLSNSHFPGFSAEAAIFLVQNRTIYGVGTDTISFDKGSSKTFPAHQILLRHGIFGLENVANVEQIPIYGAQLYVMPMKIGKASGAPTRIIASYIAPKIVQDIPSSKK